MSEQGMHTLGQTDSPNTDESDAAGSPRLFLLLECQRPASASMSIPLGELTDLQICRGTSRSLSAGPPWRLEIPDTWLSSEHARLQNSFGRWILQDAGSKNGCRVNGQAVQRHELCDGDLVEMGQTFFLFRAAAPDLGDELVDLGTLDPSRWPITLNPELCVELNKLKKLSATSIAILILGESGSGKEVLAQYIHSASKRMGRFVPVNCGALPAGLVESELFGHKKGSFSGAVSDHLGLVRSAHSGTLFLDEIADLPANAQATLLRVLQEKEVRPVGATESHAVDLRCVSATHLDLDARVKKGDFRRDLYARIAGYRTTVPPLQNRTEDMGLLIATFLEELGHTDLTLSVEVGRALLQYSWPLNIRELRSALTTATVLAEDNRIDMSHLPETVREGATSNAQTAGETSESSALERNLLALLATHEGNVSAVARAMDKDRKQIQRWIKRFAIDLNRFRGA